MKKIFCIFIMFCICIVNAWADVANPCPPDTLKKIGNWTGTCAYETDVAAKKLNKCIKYFYENCGELNAANTDTPVQYVAKDDCKEFEGKNFDQIVAYLDDQVGVICAVKKVDCPYTMLIDYWKVQCAGKEIMTDIKKFEKECNKNGDKTSVPYPGDTRTLEMIKGDLSERAEDACPSMPNVDEGCEDEDAIRLIRMWRKQCKGKSEDSFKKMVDKYEDWCANGFADNYITDELYKDYSQSDFVTKISEEINKKCKVTSNNNGGNVDYTKITGYGSALDGIIGDLDLSVWKNADGKFNTARLASDSIAGVVLGTAGGLITSSVMKKHQAADGFEDLKCVVGGQSVAGWGDVFNVGIQ